MKKLFQTLRAAGLTMLLTVPAYAQTLPFEWAVTCASGEGNYGWGPSRLILDKQGNSYVAGRFTGSILLGDFILTAPGAAMPGGPPPQDIFLAKLDAAGKYVWATQVGGGTQSTSISGLAVDATGNVYLAGGFGSYTRHEVGCESRT